VEVWLSSDRIASKTRHALVTAFLDNHRLFCPRASWQVDVYCTIDISGSYL